MDGYRLSTGFLSFLTCKGKEGEGRVRHLYLLLYRAAASLQPVRHKNRGLEDKSGLHLQHMYNCCVSDMG